MERRAKPELFNELPAGKGKPLRVRQESLRANAWLGSTGVLARTLQNTFARHLSLRVAGLGDRDGELLLRVARRLRGRWRKVDAVLPDRREPLNTETQAHFAGLNWRVQPVNEDIFEWLRRPAESIDATIASVFLHHFHEDQLRELFNGIARRTQVLIAVEPRRTAWLLACSRVLPAIGGGAATRDEARARVHAGFAGRELSALWPDRNNWELTERSAGLFGHVFIARRKKRVDGTIFQPAISAVFNRESAPDREPADAPGADGAPARDSATTKPAPPPRAE